MAITSTDRMPTTTPQCPGIRMVPPTGTSQSLSTASTSCARCGLFFSPSLCLTAMPTDAASVARQLYGSTAENGVWVLPKSHRIGQIDIGALVEQHGDRIPGRQPPHTHRHASSASLSTSLCRIRADGVSTRRRCNCQPQLPSVRTPIILYLLERSFVAPTLVVSNECPG